MKYADPRFPCSPADMTKIFRRHYNNDIPGGLSRAAHPLEGKSVRAWVAEARAGWPRVPVPGDPLKAAQKVAEKHSGTDSLSLMKYEEV